MGCQRYVDAEEMTVFSTFIFLFFWSFFEKAALTEGDEFGVKRKMLDPDSQLCLYFTTGTAPAEELVPFLVGRIVGGCPAAT